MNLRRADVPDLPGTALCAEADPEAFFPQRGESATEAKAVCRRCPVIGACLEWALDHYVFGIWAGTSELERRALKTRRVA